MYKIYLDGDLMFDAGRLDDTAYSLINPHLIREKGDGSLTFIMPPGNQKYNSIKKMKSIVTVTLDDVLLFRGRVTESESDTYNQKNVYCEGDLSFLKDSQWPEGTTTGTVQDFFSAIIDNHNSQVEEDKRFTVGIISAVDANKLVQVGDGSETRKYWNASRMILDKLVESYGGKVRTRTVGDTHYIDWLGGYTEENAQNIRFAVNLLDIKNREDAGDVFTVLIPQGYSEIQSDGTYSDPVDITSVNNGRNYIEDAEGIAKHGRIWKVHTWAATKDPAELLNKALAFMSVGMELRSLTLKAVDMHFIDGSIDMLMPYKKVHILSQPHGVDLNIACVKIDSPLMEPENTTYTFGEPPETLTEKAERTQNDVDSLTGGGGRGGRGGRKTVQEEAQEILRWAKIQVDEANAHINLNAGEINKLTGRVSGAEIDIDGLNAQIALKASQETVDALGTRLSQAEIDIDGANAQIALKASQETVDALGTRLNQAEIDIDGANAQIALKASATTVNELGERVSSAEIVIDGLNSEIHLKADKTYVQTLVASEIEAEIGTLEMSIAENLITDLVTARSAAIGALTLGGDNVTKKTLNVVTNFTPALGEDAPTEEYTLLVVA